MKISNGSINEKDNQKPKDLTEIFLEFKKEYSSAYIHQFENQIFIYRSLGRNEFKRLVEDDSLTDMVREEIVCEACTLYPEDYDFENCDEAGIPTTLSREILKNSFLDSVESRKMVLTHFRQEMFELDNQITCIINEAFPQFDIEEIEAWDVAKTSKYLSRAEWKLTNLRGMEMRFDPMDSQPEPEDPQQRQVRTEEIEESPLRQGKIETIEERQTRLNMKGGAKKKLSPEDLDEMRRKYPEMQWGDNALQELNIESFKDSIDSSSPALRPGF